MWTELQCAIKGAIRNNPAKLKGEALAVHMGVSTGRLYGWGDGAQEEVIPLNRLVQLVHISGDIRPIAALAAICGGVFIPTSTLRSTADEQALATMVQDFGELLQAHAKAVADNKLTETELKQIENECAKLQQAIAAFMMSLREKGGL